MKNWEKYEEKIKALGIHDFSVTKDGEARECSDKSCRDCIFNSDRSCMYEMSHWLYDEAEDFDERD